jgi:hypothetical protein
VSRRPARPLHPAQQHGGVLAAEGDAVGDGMLDVELAPDVGHVIEIAVGVGLVHIDGGRGHAVAHGQQGGGDAGGSAAGDLCAFTARRPSWTGGCTRLIPCGDEQNRRIQNQSVVGS